MRALRAGAVAMVLVCAVMSGCADEPTAGPSPSELVRGLDADLVAGGGADPSAKTSSEVRLELGLTDNAQSRVVADDKAFWTVRRGTVGACSATPKDAWNDGLSRVSPDGHVTSIDFGFIDTTHLDGASSGDCPTIIAGPVAAANGSVIVTVSSQAKLPTERRWWRSYIVAPDGSAKLWEPPLPAGYRPVAVGRSAGPEILVVGGYREDWDAKWDQPNLAVDTYRLFAVDQVTSQVRALGRAAEPSATAALNDPVMIGDGGTYPLTSRSLALLSDGRLAYWSDVKGSEGLWVQGDNGLMAQIIDEHADIPAAAKLQSAAPGQSVGTLAALAGSGGWRLEPGPDGSALLFIFNPAFAGLSADMYRVGLTGVPKGSEAQAIVDGAFTSVGPTVGLQDGQIVGVTVLLGADAMLGNLDAPVSVVNVGRSDACTWDFETAFICGTPRDGEDDLGIWKDWVYYRVSVPAAKLGVAVVTETDPDPDRFVAPLRAALAQAQASGCQTALAIVDDLDFIKGTGVEDALVTNRGKLTYCVGVPLEDGVMVRPIAAEAKRGQCGGILSARMSSNGVGLFGVFLPAPLVGRFPPGRAAWFEDGE